MNDTVTPNIVNASAGPGGPGRRLAEARKALGLSLEEIAGQLRLGVSTLEALENDDRSNLPPPAFVSGYLRSYARIVGIPEQELAQVAAVAETPITSVVATGPSNPMRASDPSVRLVSYIVFGALIVVSSAWWLIYEDEPGEKPVQEITQSTAPVEPDALGASATESPEAAQDAAAGLSEGTVAGAAEADAPAVATEPEQPAVEEVPAKRAHPPLGADTPQSKIRLVFSEDCWISVTDKAGRQLAYELYNGGKAVTLRGEAPFKIFFGYSPGVQVFFNDQLFDHKPFQRRETARFRLGTSEDNAPLTEAN